MTEKIAASKSGAAARAILPLLLLIFSASAQAPSTGWYTGSSHADSFNISNARQLAGLAELVNSGNDFSGKTVTLVNDVDLSVYGKGTSFNGGKGWVPISGFAGTFDGGGRVIRGLYINDTVLSSSGLFGSVSGGTVKSIGVLDADVTGKDDVGIVAGRLLNEGVLEGSYSTGAVSGANFVGGVVGRIGAEYNEDGGRVAVCYSAAAVKGNNGVGGVVGFAYNGSVGSSYSTGAVIGRNRVGGVAGGMASMVYLGGRVSERKESSMGLCYSTGTVAGHDTVGGVVGHVWSGNVYNSYSTAAVSGNSSVGGVAGAVGYEVEITNGQMSMGNCYMPCTGMRDKDDACKGDENCCSERCYSPGSENNMYGKVEISAALNPSVHGKSNVGRVFGKAEKADSAASNNVAFAGLKDRGDRTDRWTVKGSNTGDGADITAAQLTADPTLGGRFKNTDYGWATSPGKLPGLRGKAADMPSHLRN